MEKQRVSGIMSVTYHSQMDSECNHLLTTIGVVFFLIGQSSACLYARHVYPAPGPDNGPSEVLSSKRVLSYTTWPSTIGSKMVGCRRPTCYRLPCAGRFPFPWANHATLA